MHISTAERRRRLAVRHFLAEPAGDVEAVADRLVGLHSSDPTTVYLSAWARVAGFTRNDLAAALYERRSLLRMLGMRKTLFVQTRHNAAVMDSACTRKLAPPEHRRTAKLLEEAGIADDGDAWIDDVIAKTQQAFDVRGAATARELKEDVPELRQTIEYAPDKSYGGRFGIVTRVLFLMAAKRMIVRAEPVGSWVSGQYRWARLHCWIGTDLDEFDTDDAQAELLRRWLAAFGPGTTTDLKWWTGWTVRDTKAALAAIDAVEVGLDEGTGWVLPDDVDQTDKPGPWAALLPSLDPTTMGWKERKWYLGDYTGELFDRNGNAGHTIWVDGRVVGAWAARDNGHVVWELLEDVGSEAEALIEVRAAVLQEWLDGTSISPRFSAPLDKRLAKG